MLSGTEKKFNNPRIESVRKKGTKRQGQRSKRESDRKSPCKPE